MEWTHRWFTPTPSGNPWRYYIVDVVPGDTLIINGTGGNASRIWGVLDSSNVLLSVSPASISLVNYEMVAPADASKIIINDNSGSTSYIIKKESLQGQISGVAKTLNDKVEDLDFAVQAGERYIDLTPTALIITGYANTSGKFISIGSSVTYGFDYVPVVSGKTYRIK